MKEQRRWQWCKRRLQTPYDYNAPSENSAKWSLSHERVDGIGTKSSNRREEHLSAWSETQHGLVNAWSKIQKMAFSVQDQTIMVHTRKTVTYNM